MPFCTQCGSRNPDDANFCASCGSRLVKPEQLQAPSPEPETPAEHDAEAPPAVPEQEPAGEMEAAESAGEQPADVAPEAAGGADPETGPEADADTGPEAWPESGPEESSSTPDAAAIEDEPLADAPTEHAQHSPETEPDVAAWGAAPVEPAEPDDTSGEDSADAQPDQPSEPETEPEPEQMPLAEDQGAGSQPAAADATSTLTFGAPSTAEIREVPGTGEQSSLDDDDAAAVDALPQGSALLVVQRGPGAGNRFLLDQDVVTAGRHPESEIFLDDITVSRRHVEFRRAPDGFRVADVGSLNGTYVNRDRIDEAALQNGDEVQIGKFRLVYFTGDVPADH